MIRTWRYDAAARKFEHLALLEGHLRAVTCVLLNGTHIFCIYLSSYCRLKIDFDLDSCLWSGSVDRTIRVWEVGTGKCLGVLTKANGGNGHSEAVSCLTLIPPTSAGGDAYIASGGGDGDVKLWKTNGEYVHSCSHGVFITALNTFQDSMGGKTHFSTQ